MSTSLRSHRRPVGRGALGLAASLAVIATFLVPIVINPPAALAATSTGIGSGVECANDNWQAETAADDAGHVYVFYTNYCSNHDFLWFQVSNDGGQTFGPAQALCSALGAACTVPQANTHTIGGTGYKTEDDPGLFVDTSVSPPKLYVVWDATQSFNTFVPDSVLGAVSNDFGATFTMLNGGANIPGANCGSGGNTPDCGFPQITAKGSNVTVASGSYATGGAKHNQVKTIMYSSNGGTSFAGSATNGTSATNGNWYYALRSVLDSSGNTWTLWFDYDGTAGAGTFLHYELSKTASGSATTTWVTSFYTAPDGPTYPGAGMASTGGYPAGWWGGTADLAIDSSNKMTVVFQDGRGHTTDGNPSILKAGSCALASGTCTALGAAAGSWTPQASTVRVDDKDASGACGGTEAGSTAKCSVSFPRLTSTPSGTLYLSWVDDRKATVAGCSPNPQWSHTCGLNMWMRTSSTGISGFTTPSVQLSDHTAFSPVGDSDTAGFKFFYGGSDGIASTPACTNQPVAAWTESVDYNGGSTNGGRVFAKNTQSGPASPASLTAIPSGTTINLSWPASTGSGVTGYKVYRGSGSTGDNLTPLTTLGNVTSYANTGLTTGQTFTYAVSAIGGSEGCQSVRSSATAGATVRTLTLATSPGAVGCSNITTTPAPTSGNGTCTRTYADGAVVTVSATSPVAIDATSRYRFNQWSGAASGSGSPTVTMNADKSVTANYVKQWAVTIKATGLNCNAPLSFYCDTGNNTVATVQGTPYIGSDVAYGDSGFPTKAYVDDGGTLTYSFSSTLAAPGSTDIPQTLAADANKQYRADSLSGPASGSTVSSAVTINETYVTQRKVTFSQTGIGGDSTGTVVQVTGTGTNPANASLGAGSLGSAAFYDDGSAWSYSSPVSSSTAGKRYTASANSGTLSAGDEGTTKSSTYTTQWLLTLATNPGGIGTGHITPNPTSASGYYNSGTSVQLTADTAVSSGGSPYTFQNWTGDVATPPNSSNPVSVTMGQARNVTANYSLDSFGLSVTKNGNGSGTVTSSPAGINCGATCSSSYTYGTSVTLTATPATGSDFTGWSVSGCSGTGTCVVTVDAAKSVTATFTLQTETLTVSKNGNGSGSVTSSPVGINCGSTCSAGFDYGTSVTLTATPSTGSDFTGWSGGGCSGTGTCMVSVTAATSVTAQFTLQTKTLDVTTNGNGSGSVGSSPAGITCGATCSAGFDYGTVVTLTATPAASSDFTGWSGSGCSGTSTCIVTMDAARSVTATFTLKME